MYYTTVFSGSQYFYYFFSMYADFMRKRVYIMYEVFELLLKKYGITAYKFCKDTNTSQSTIYTWKNKRNLAGSKLSKTVCDYFGVSLNYLMTGKEDPEKKEITLAPKDEREISKIIEETRMQLLSQEGLMFDGEPASPEAIDSILSAMQIGMEMAKKKNKEKYTPKKYKKD